MKSRQAWNRQTGARPRASVDVYPHTRSILVCFFLLVLFSLFLLSSTTHVAWADECPAGGKHSYSAVIEKPATDDTDGIRRFTCTKCGYSFTQTIEATGHQWSEWVVDYPATCTTPGQEWRVCKRYSPHYEYRTIPPLSPTGKHDFVKTDHRDATCTENGFTTYTCSICGESYSDTYLATGHNWGVWETVKQATATEEGLEQRVCINDGAHVETRPTPLAPEAAVTSSSTTSSQTTTENVVSEPRVEEEEQEEPDTILGLPSEFFTAGADNTTAGIVGSGFFLWLLLFITTVGLYMRSHWAAMQRKAARNDARAARQTEAEVLSGVK